MFHICIFYFLLMTSFRFYSSVCKLKIFDGPLLHLVVSQLRSEDYHCDYEFHRTWKLKLILLNAVVSSLQNETCCQSRLFSYFEGFFSVIGTERRLYSDWEMNNEFHCLKLSQSYKYHHQAELSEEPIKINVHSLGIRAQHRKLILQITGTLHPCILQI